MPTNEATHRRRHHHHHHRRRRRHHPVEKHDLLSRYRAAYSRLYRSKAHRRPRIIAQVISRLATCQQRLVELRAELARYHARDTLHWKTAEIRGKIAVLVNEIREVEGNVTAAREWGRRVRVELEEVRRAREAWEKRLAVGL